MDDVKENITTENSIDKPAELKVDYATFWARVAALLIDSVLLALVAGMLSGGRTFNETNQPNFLESFLYIVYYVLMTTKFGATLGKMALKIKVVNAETGQNLTFGEAVLREVVGKFVSGAAIFIGYIWMLWDSKKQTWHDKIAKSFVVRADN